MIELGVTLRTDARRRGLAALLAALLLAGLTWAGFAAQPSAGVSASVFVAQATVAPLPTTTPPPTNTAIPTPASAVTATPTVYTVQPGDSATLIARRFGVTLEVLLAANNIQNPNIVELGRQLVIPVGVPVGALAATPLATLTVSPVVAEQATLGCLKFIPDMDTAHPPSRALCSALRRPIQARPLLTARPPAEPTPWPQPNEAATANLDMCPTRALLILHTFWNGAPEPGVRFDFHSQPFNANNDPSKFRFQTNENGTAYFCMPDHTRLYFFLDRDMGFDERLDRGQVVEKVINVPRLDLTLKEPVGSVAKPDTPVKFSWAQLNGAAYYELSVWGEQRNFWGGSPSVMVYEPRVQAPQTEVTTLFSFDAEKGLFPGGPIRWLVKAFNTQGVVIGTSTMATFTMLP